MTAADPFVSESDDADGIREELDELYPGKWALLLISCCEPDRPHQHPDKNGNMVPCPKPGKRPTKLGWNAAAVERWRLGEGREEHLAAAARHIASGGNVGLAVPPGLLILDADTPEAVATLDRIVDNAPMQTSRIGRAHFVVRVPVPVSLSIDANVKREIADGVHVDLRTAGRSQIVVAPSRHFTGSMYTWCRSLPENVDDLPECPAAILEKILESKPASDRESTRSVPEGKRNDHLYRVACGMRGRGMSEREIREELHRENARHCSPPLNRDEVEAIVSSAMQFAAGDPSPRHHDHPTAGGASAPPEDYFSSEGLLVEKLASAIQREGHVALSADGRLYRYRAGVWRPDGETFARVRVREILARRFKRRHVDEVLAWLRAHEATIPERPPAEFMNLSNGVLAWATGELRPHGPEIVSTIQLPVAWTPSARCERFEKFLGDILPPEAHDFVFELLGYLIFTGNPLRVAVLLLGPGRNGKSTLLSVIVALLGSENVATLPLQVLAENRFAAAELCGRLANVCGDLDARAVKHTDTFKMLTGGDRMSAERKHGAMFTFQPFAVPVFSANEPPVSSDQTEAWFDRWLVLPMERRLAEDAVDPRLAERLTTRAELEGVLVRAVEGLRRLMGRGRFDLPDVVRRGREDYREQLDTVAGFLAEDALLDPTVGHAPRAELYRAYRAWCVDSGRLPVSAAKFYARLRDAHPGAVEERVLHGVRGFAGIRLRVVRGGSA